MEGRKRKAESLQRENHKKIKIDPLFSDGRKEKEKKEEKEEKGGKGGKGGKEAEKVLEEAQTAFQRSSSFPLVARQEVCFLFLEYFQIQ